MNTITNQNHAVFTAKLRIEDPEMLIPKSIISKYTEVLKPVGKDTDEVFIRAFEDRSKKPEITSEFLEGNVKIAEKVVKSFGERVVMWGDRISTMNKNIEKIVNEKIKPSFEK